MNGRGFTPGPWKVETLGHSLRVTKAEYDDDNDDIAIVGDVRNETDVATARLIATAPILLQELRGANTQMEMAAECIEAGRYDEALLHVRSMSRSRRAAIAEATGEQL